MIQLERPYDAIDDWENEGGAIIDRQPWRIATYPAVAPVVVDETEVAWCPVTRAHIDHRPARTASTREWVAYWLTRIPDLAAEQPLYLLPGTRPADPTSWRGKGSPARPPVTLDVIDTTDTRLKDTGDLTPAEAFSYDQRDRLGVLPYLGLWVSLVMDELIDCGIQPDVCCPLNNGDTITHTVTGETRWLLRYLDQILDLHPDFADDVHRIYRQLQQGVGERDPFALKCDRCTWPVDPQDGASWFKCSGCGKQWTLVGEIKRLAGMQPNMPLRKIATILGRSLGTLQKWAIEGRFLPVGRQGQTFLYDLERVRTVADQFGTRKRA